MTKRVYEAAKEYGVPAKTVIKTLEDHHIKAGNFTGIDANMKSILDASSRRVPRGKHNVDRNRKINRQGKELAEK